MKTLESNKITSPIKTDMAHRKSKQFVNCKLVQLLAKKSVCCGNEKDRSFIDKHDDEPEKASKLIKNTISSLLALVLASTSTIIIILLEKREPRI